MNRITLNHMADTALCHLIAQSVADQFGISFIDLCSRRRTRQVSIARHIYFWLCRMYTKASFPCIASTIDKDHTSAMHGYNKMMRTGVFQLYKPQIQNVVAACQL